jgi:hypothetical protein
VASTLEGRNRRFRLTPGPMREAIGWLAEVGAEGTIVSTLCAATLRRPTDASHEVDGPW